MDAWGILAAAAGILVSLLAAAREIGRREGIREEQARIQAEAARQAADAVRRAAAAADAYKAAGGARGAAGRGEY
jgi:hypothetical protein